MSAEARRTLERRLRFQADACAHLGSPLRFDRYRYDLGDHRWGPAGYHGDPLDWLG